MSHIRMPGAAPSARQVRQLTRSLSSKLAGRTRGPDPEVRRGSYDVDDPKAKPWARIGDGSPGQGLAHVGALVQTADELRRQDWKELPPAEVRAARAKRDTVAAELARYEEGEPASPGWPATLRLELARLDETCARARAHLRRIDVTVLKALLSRLDFASGRLFPSYETIADLAACSRNAAIAAIARLKARGFIEWVRRSVRSGTAGTFGPQRAQTSNGYSFDWRRKMAPRTWQRFWQLLVVRLRRLGATPATLRPAMPAKPSDGSPLRAAIDSLGASVTNASP